MHEDVIQIHIEPEVLLLGRFGTLSRLPRELRDPVRAQLLLRRLVAEPDAMRQIRNLLPAYSLNRYSDQIVLEMVDGAIQNGDLQAIVVEDVGTQEPSDAGKTRPGVSSASRSSDARSTPASGQAGPVRQWPLENRIAEVISRTPPRIPGNAGKEALALLAPEGLAAVAGAIAGASASSAPYGWAADAVVAGLAFGFGGLTAIHALDDLVEGLKRTSNAKTEQDLDAAAEALARAATALGPFGLMAVLRRVVAPKRGAGGGAAAGGTERLKPPQEKENDRAERAAEAAERAARLEARWKAAQQAARAERQERGKQAHEPSVSAEIVGGGKGGHSPESSVSAEIVGGGKGGHSPESSVSAETVGGGKEGHSPEPSVSAEIVGGGKERHRHEPSVSAEIVGGGKEGHHHEPSVSAEIVGGGIERRHHEPSVSAEIVGGGKERHKHEPSVSAEIVGGGKERHKHEPSVSAEIVGGGKERHKHEPEVSAEFFEGGKERHKHEPGVSAEFFEGGKERRRPEPSVEVEFFGGGEEQRRPEPSVDVELIGGGKALDQPGPPENQNLPVVAELEGGKPIPSGPSESGKTLPPEPPAPAALSGDGQELPGPAPSEDQNLLAAAAMPEDIARAAGASQQDIDAMNLLMTASVGEVNALRGLARGAQAPQRVGGGVQAAQKIEQGVQAAQRVEQGAQAAQKVDQGVQTLREGEQGVEISADVARPISATVSETGFGGFRATFGNDRRAFVMFEPKGRGVNVTDIFRGDRPKGSAGAMLADALRKAEITRPETVRVSQILENQPTLKQLAEGVAAGETVLGRTAASAIKELGGKVTEWTFGEYKGKTWIEATISYAP
jgi:hypothetical protein